MDNSRKSVAVIGAGISGLVTAYRLDCLGLNVEVFEAEDRVGGFIRSDREGEWLAEAGPHTFMDNAPEIHALIEEIGLASDLCEPAPAAKKRFVVRAGKPHPLPLSVASFLKTPLLSTKAKLRLFREPFISRWDNRYEESLSHFIQRRLGPEILDYVVNPFVSGIYAGDPDELSVKSAFPRLFRLEQEYGSLLRGTISGGRKRRKKAGAPRRKPQMYSFREGMGQLVARLGEKLEHRIRMGVKIGSIRQHPASPGGWILAGHSKETGPEEEGRYDGVVSTVPLQKMPEIILENGAFDCSRLRETVHPPVGIFTMGFRRDQVAHPLDGFGMLLPAREESVVLGTLFTSTLFPGRAPAHHVTVAGFVGGARNPQRALQPPEAQKEDVLRDLERFLGVRGEPVWLRHKFHKEAIPQYNIGYDEILKVLDDLEKNQRGLYFTGNYRSGISVSDCIKGGLQTAEKIYGMLT